MLVENKLEVGKSCDSQYETDECGIYEVRNVCSSGESGAKPNYVVRSVVKEPSEGAIPKPSFSMLVKDRVKNNNTNSEPISKSEV